jgi:protein phosphatase
VGGAYAGWRYTQSQYYVGEDGGKVVIFRGINQSVAGIKLYSVVQRTSIPVASLPSMDASTVRATITSNSGLPGARDSVATLQADYQKCQQAYAALRTWETTPPTTKKVRHGKKTITEKVKPPKPTIPAECPAPASAAAGTGG